jgi:hypothetical protein
MSKYRTTTSDKNHEAIRAADLGRRKMVLPRLRRVSFEAKTALLLNGGINKTFCPKIATSRASSGFSLHTPSV